MKNLALIVLVMMVSLTLTVPIVMADKTTEMLVTVSIAPPLSISVDTQNWDIGEVEPGTEYVVGGDFIVTNDGGVSAYILVSIPSSTGTGMDYYEEWTHGETRGPDTYTIEYAKAGSDSWSLVSPGEMLDIFEGLEVGGSFSGHFRLGLPTQSSIFDPQYIRILFTADLGPMPL